RAAVAFGPGKPLEVTTVKVQGPRAGEVLVEIKATGICHTDEFTLSGADPEGLSCHRGWGRSITIGVAGAGAGKEIAARPFQLVTGRSRRGTAFGGARGRTDVPKIVDWYMDGKINIDDLITHVLPFEQ